MDTPPVLPPAGPEQIQSVLVECGLTASKISIMYDEVLQGYSILVPVDAGASRENLECIWRASHNESVRFGDAKLNDAFRQLTEDHYLPMALEDFKQSLAKQGLLAGLPKRVAFANNEAFAKAIEVHCGSGAGEVLEVRDDLITFRPDAMKGDVSELQFQKFSCLLSALALASQESKAFKMGFIGNEAVSEPEKK